MLVTENTMLRIFGPRKEEETGGWKKLHKEEFLHKILILLTKMKRTNRAG
jgi:hypothetical protein